MECRVRSVRECRVRSVCSLSDYQSVYYVFGTFLEIHVHVYTLYVYCGLEYNSLVHSPRTYSSKASSLLSSYMNSMEIIGVLTSPFLLVSTITSFLLMWMQSPPLSTPTSYIHVLYFSVENDRNIVQKQLWSIERWLPSSLCTYQKSSPQSRNDRKGLFSKQNEELVSRESCDFHFIQFQGQDVYLLL